MRTNPSLILTKYTNSNKVSSSSPSPTSNNMATSASIQQQQQQQSANNTYTVPFDDTQLWEALKARHADAEANGTPTPTYLMFWGHTDKSGNSKVSKVCLSQWYPSPFTVGGRTYHTAEHWMMAQKALLFAHSSNNSEIEAHNLAIIDEILAIEDPQAVKKLGRNVKGFDEALWVAHRYDIVLRGNYHKFTQNAALGRWLTSSSEETAIKAAPSSGGDVGRSDDSTAAVVFVEASPYDTIWGIGLIATDPLAASPLTWKGTNLLGFAIGEVRQRLLKERVYF